MVCRLNDDQLVVRCAVDEPVLIIDPPGPEAGQVAPQRLRLAGALERRAPSLLDQPDQAPQLVLISTDPVCEILPAPEMKDDRPQPAGPSLANVSSSSIVFFSSPRPRRTSSAARARRSALTGERIR